MNTTLSIAFLRPELTKPYKLSFGSISHFDTFYVALIRGGRIGLGEITPLPGYGHETPGLVKQELLCFADKLRAGEPWRAAFDGLADRAPMTASGLGCALDTLGMDHEDAWGAVPVPLAMASFCSGDTPGEIADNARALAAKGFQVLKLKVGRFDAAQEAALVRAACQAMPRGSVRMDANQRSTPEHARELVGALKGLPVEHFEQPFAPDAWDLHAQLAKESPIPVLLDESIIDLTDIQKAAACGIRAVKLKLCKHPGLKETDTMIRQARAQGMRVIFGNGVQTGLGNHLEARLAWRTGLDTALECNGFHKMAAAPEGHRLRLDQGRLVDDGILADATLSKASCIASCDFPSTQLDAL